MILTRKQEEGLNIALERYRNGKPFTVISGYAGTGKSTLVSYIIDALQVDPKLVAYVAYTGKAAQVLKDKGCPNAITAHKLLYESRQMPNGYYMFEPRDSFDKKYEVIVVDEVSMLPQSMWTLLLSHGIYVLACGDPEQLPPIDKEDTNNVLENPHVFLDEIMRQAYDSEIIRLSMHVREGKPLETFQYVNKEVQRFNREDLVTGMYSWADQIICATNKTRIDINAQVRQIKGFGPEPQVGDKIIGLKNHWDLHSTQHSPLTNGCIGEITDIFTDQITLPYFAARRKLPLSIDTYNATFKIADDDYFERVQIDAKGLLTGKKLLTPAQEFAMQRTKAFPNPPLAFNYGYAITCWKAQGSQWDKVLFFEEGFPFEENEHRRYLYTGITRAAKKLVLIQ